MHEVWGIILVIFTLILCWLIQVINTLSPMLVAQWGLNEPEAHVDATFYTDTRGEAIWDAMTIWTLPVAGILLSVIA